MSHRMNEIMRDTRMQVVRGKNREKFSFFT